MFFRSDSSELEGEDTLGSSFTPIQILYIRLPHVRRCLSWPPSGLGSVVGNVERTSLKSSRTDHR